jgi:hypothetical protein
VVALFLGIKGILPGTRSDKLVNHKPAPTPSAAPLAIQTPAPPPIPPVIGTSPLGADDEKAIIESCLQQYSGEVISLLDPDLFGLLMSCLTDKKTFTFVIVHSSRPSREDIAAFEHKIGILLPQEFRDFCKTKFGCLCFEVNERVWPRPKAGDIVPAWYMSFALYVYGFSAGVPDNMDIRKQFAAFSKSGHRLVPFLKLAGSNNQYCFTPERGIVLWHAATGVVEPVDLSFTALLIREIETLLERAQKIQNEPNPYA